MWVMGGRVQMLLSGEQKAAVPLNTINHWLQTPAAAAYIKGNKAALALLTAAGGKLVCSMHASFYPLHTAALNGDVGEPLLSTSWV